MEGGWEEFTYPKLRGGKGVVNHLDTAGGGHATARRWPKERVKNDFGTSSVGSNLFAWQVRSMLRPNLLSTVAYHYAFWDCLALATSRSYSSATLLPSEVSSLFKSYQDSSN